MGQPSRRVTERLTHGRNYRRGRGTEHRRATLGTTRASGDRFLQGSVLGHRGVSGGTDDSRDVVAQLSVGDATFWVSDESPAHENFSPESLGGGTVRMLLIVDDPDRAMDRAKTAGATEVYAVAEARLAPRPGEGPVRPPLGDREAARTLAAT
jgi:hypothetical protein